MLTLSRLPPLVHSTGNTAEINVLHGIWRKSGNVGNLFLEMLPGLADSQDYRIVKDSLLHSLKKKLGDLISKLYLMCLILAKCHGSVLQCNGLVM
jgi:hypothetical protein